MRAARYEGPGNIRVVDAVPPTIEDDTDVIVRVTNAAIGVPDMWAYRGFGGYEPGSGIGQEFVGVVHEVGKDVRSVRPGDLVVSPNTWSCGRCEYCRAGLQTSCGEGGYYGEPGSYGAQGEFVRVPLADGTLIVAPNSMLGEEMRLLPLTAALPAGHHAALAAKVAFGRTVTIIGDGAYGLSAVLMSRRLGATDVIVVGHHEERLEVASEFGASAVVLSRNTDEASEKVMSLTGGVDSVIEAVGEQSALDLAFAVVKDGGAIGYVGVPHAVDGIDLGVLYGHNISLAGGIAPGRAYLPMLLQEVVDGRLDADPILDLTVGIEELADGYAMMDDRLAIKAHVQF